MSGEIIGKRSGIDIKILSIGTKPDFSDEADNHKIEKRWDILVGVDNTDQTVWLEYNPKKENPWGIVFHREQKGKTRTYVRRSYHTTTKLLDRVYKSLVS